MPTLLHLDSSPLTSSVSRELSREFVKSWKAAHPDGRVLSRNLNENSAPPVDEAWVYAAFTPEESRTPEQKAALALSDKLVDELLSADEIVLGVAMYNFSIPAVLKLWIDQISRAGRTFTFSSNGPEGLVKGRKATILVASGSVYEPGSAFAPYNFVDPYLKTFLGFIGITDVAIVSAGGTSGLMSGAVTREALLAPALAKVREIAA
jgi:FMN-dependent NADH-azoreductase